MKVRQAVALAAHVASRNSTLPILSHVRIDSGSVSACDLETQIEIPTDMPAGMTEAFCVHAARLGRILKALPEDAELKLRVKDKRLHVSAGTTRYELNTLPSEDFPQIATPADEALSITSSGAPLLKGLLFCRAAMGVADIRFYLNGLHASILPGRIQLTATDGHRLHRAVVEIEKEEGWKPAQAIIPRATVERLIEIVGAHGDISLALTPALFVVETAGETMKAKLIDGVFPEGDRVIPSTRAVTGQLPRKAFVAAVRRMAQIHTGDKWPGVVLKVRPESIELSASNTNQEVAEETFAWKAADPRFTKHEVGLNVQFLTEAFDSFTDDDVNVHLGTDANDSIYFTDSGEGRHQVVLMPMRI